MIFALSLLIIIKLATSFEELDFYNKNNTTSGLAFHENILCRSCGNEITFSSSIISEISSSSQYSYHDSIFRKDEVLIQVLMNDLFFPYPIFTTSLANCVGISEWEEADSWFPGYRWKPCVCPDCGALIGWVFEPINPYLVDQQREFFGLILTSHIGETCKYILFRWIRFVWVWDCVCPELCLSCLNSVVQLSDYCPINVLSCLCGVN